MGLIIFSLLTIFVYVSLAEKHPIVVTEQGKIEGSLSENELYYEFLGIRYAVPVKFKTPLPPPSFPGVYKADARGVACAQFASNDPLSAPSDNEDCLILNVFTPTDPHNTTLGVIVFLHGGDFGVGTSSPIFYGPQYLVTQDVIVVTMNYRLNIYGFLNLGISDAPGNAGLKDIRQGLRWIKRNIKVFGGDAENVTVFGHGSGGSAAIYLMLSESTKHLFKRIISLSGSIFTPQSFDPKPVVTAKHFAKSLGANPNKLEDLLKLYAETTVDRIEDAISKQMHAASLFAPSVEDVFEGEEAFLTDTPYNILALGKSHPSFNPVPVIIGVNTVEGLISTLDYNTITSQMHRIQNEDYSALDQRSLLVPKEDTKEVRNLLKETYFGNGTEDKDALLGGMINLNSDFSYVGPLELFADLLANHNESVYCYIFDYKGNRNFGTILTNSSLPATTHLDDLYYIFEMDRLSLPIDENDARIINFMTTMFTNFAQYGTPTPDKGNGEWLPHPHRLAVRLIPEYVEPLTAERAYFWRSLYYKYGADVHK